MSIQGSEEKLKFNVVNIFNAGYTGVDQGKVQEHIDELSKLGVASSSTVKYKH